MTVPQLEHFILAKPYFDRNGLLIAEDETSAPIGFVHAGFGPNEDRSDVGYNVGVICMVQMKPDQATTELAMALLEAAEAYLQERGSQRAVGGPHPPQTPFYHGLCGSGELPGILQADTAMHAAFSQAGYAATNEFAVMECELGQMRPVVDRNQRSLPKSFDVRPTMDHTFDNWWESCAFSPVQRSDFQLVSKSDNRVCGSLMWWDLDPTTSDRREPGVAISRLQISDDRRRTGLATFLLSNALRQLKSSGAFRAQVQVPVSNAPAVEFFRKLGFAEVDRGVAYEKQLAS